MAEWLGRGLQNLEQRFNSASHLHFVTADFSLKREESGFFVWIIGRWQNRRFEALLQNRPPFPLFPN